jgi:hypothetical protein
VVYRSGADEPARISRNWSAMTATPVGCRNVTWLPGIPDVVTFL